MIPMLLRSPKKEPTPRLKVVNRFLEIKVMGMGGPFKTKKDSGGLWEVSGNMGSFSKFTGPSKQNKSWTPLGDPHTVAGAIRRLARAAKLLGNRRQSETPAMNCRPHCHAIVAFALSVYDSSASVNAPLEFLTCRQQ